MEQITSLFVLLAALSLGLTAGALLAEAGVLVPFWRSLPAADFLAWYKVHAALLQNFFGPLEIAATLLTMVAAALAWWNTAAAKSPALLFAAAILAIATLAVFPIYFQKANTSFATGTIAAKNVPNELRRWSRWHWFRTGMAAVAFTLAVLAQA